jgi:hypothetical protein
VESQRDPAAAKIREARERACDLLARNGCVFAISLRIRLSFPTARGPLLQAPLLARMAPIA